MIEGLPLQTFPIKMPNGVTYHPQNEALLQWFEFKSPSNAINRAHSYPDITGHNDADGAFYLRKHKAPPSIVRFLASGGGTRPL